MTPWIPVANVVTFLSFIFFQTVGAYFDLNQKGYLVAANKSKNIKWRWKNTWTSLIHSSLSATGAVVCLLNNTALITDVIHAYSTPAHLTTAFSFGYFIFDAFDMAMNNTRSSYAYELLFHHILVIVCFGLATFHGQYLGFAMVSLAIEIHSIFLHWRQLLLYRNTPKDSWIFLCVNLANIGTCIVFRLGTLAWMGRELTLIQNKLSLAVYRIGSLTVPIVFVMSCVLLFRILKADLIKSRGSKKTSANISYD